MSAAIQTAAVGVDVIKTLAGGGQVRFQTFFPQGDIGAAGSGLVDGLVLMAERQAAQAELPDLQEQLTKMESELAQYDEDRKVVEASHVKRQAERAVEYSEIEAQHTTTHAVAYEEFRASGRDGVFEPRGHVAANLNRFVQAKAKIKAEIDKADAERDAAVKNLAISIERRQAEIARLATEITRRRSLVG
jgi:predicted nuclease with TOPRIM domain